MPLPSSLFHPPGIVLSRECASAVIDEREGKVTQRDLVKGKKEGKESRLVHKHTKLSNTRKNIEIDKIYLYQVERQRQEDATVGHLEII